MAAAPLTLVLLMLAVTIGFRYPLNGLLVGNFTGSMLLLLSLGVLLLKRGNDVAAGVYFALAAVPPQIAGVLVLAVLLVLRRWRGLAAFIGTLALLTLISIAMIGWWLPDWIAGLFAYADYSFPVWALGLLEAPLLRIIAVLLLGGLLWSSVPFIALTIAVLLLVPQTGNYYLTLLIPALIVLARRGWWLAFGLLIAAPWAILAWLPGYEALVMPTLVGVCFGWMMIRNRDRAANEQPL